MTEHKGIRTDHQRFTAFDGEVPYFDLFGNHVGEWLDILFAAECVVEIGKDFRSRITVVRRIVVDDQTVYRNFFWHIACIAKIVLSRITPADQHGIDPCTVAREEFTVANDDFSVKGAAVVAAQVDEHPAADFGVLDQKYAMSDEIHPLMSQYRIFDRGIRDPLVGIETGKFDGVEREIFGKVGTENPPSCVVMNVVIL